MKPPAIGSNNNQPPQSVSGQGSGVSAQNPSSTKADNGTPAAKPTKKSITGLNGDADDGQYGGLNKPSYGGHDEDDEDD